jgi:hypothetical protein
MSNQVYANNMEVSCKQAAGKSICAFPDVCMTPPQTPATPPGVPIPYPNTGMASDTSDGSTSVKISDQEVMLKNKSCFKKSTGDEAGAAPMKGVVTHKNTGKVYFTAWSMDVKFESENVVRMLDMTTHNHGSLPGNSPPWPYIDEAAVPGITKTCEKEVDNEKKACSDGKGNYKSADECCEDDECQKARACMVVPYGGSGSPNCCKGKTGHHILPNSLLQSTRDDSSTNVAGLKKAGDDAYTVNKGPVVCVPGASNHEGEHGEIHEKTKDKLRAILEKPAILTYEAAKTEVSKALEEVSPGCKADCTSAQIEASLKPHRTGGDIQVRQKDGTTVKSFPPPTTGGKKKP